MMFQPDSARSKNRETSFDRAERLIPDSHAERNLAGAKRSVYWLDHPDKPAAQHPLLEDITTDLAVVGGGYTGLWTALIAKERDPQRDVVVLEAAECGWAASGRNGGFCEASITHGESNGEKHLTQENERLIELGDENLEELVATIERYKIDCDLTHSGMMEIATEKHQVRWLQDEAQPSDVIPSEQGPEFLDGPEARARINTPLAHAGLLHRTGTVMVHPAKLAWGLKKVCVDLGVRIFENSRVTGLNDDTQATPAGTQSGTDKASSVVVLDTDNGTVHANLVALATNIFPNLIRRNRLYTVPVYDYALMTEPLTDAQRAAVGWAGMEGLADLNNRFHYVRPTLDADGRFRILIGGYDAVYHFGRAMRSEYLNSEETYLKLAKHFAALFPDLDDVRFSHAWGGAIDTCSRFFSFFDRSFGGRVVYAGGFTGLGVGATRFAAKVILDLLSGERTELTELEMVRKKPIPFPPEPFAWTGVKITTAAMVRADRREGKRGLWLKAMDAVGMGFDS